ncbi:MAG: SMP-30/gluconolactonase/LRE family protein [Chloroflexi bacterium]|nr:SMP-30/gluconolactonase/LRE family protein [Chloroflexota bacterium]
MYEVEHLLSMGSELGEGPLWHPSQGKLYWVDIVAGLIHRVTPGQGEVETFPVGQPVGALGLREKGGFILALKRGLHFWDPATQQLEFLVDPEADQPQSRFNDAAVDRRGRFWAGTLDQDNRSVLYRYDPDRALHVMQTDILLSNGIGWSPDNRTMYYSVSLMGAVLAYDFDLDSGSLANRRVFADYTGQIPDGLTVDSEGFVWVAVWGGWRVDRYDPAGKLAAQVKMPVAQPTCPAFGGENLDELYITSAWQGLNAQQRQEQPLAGDVFRIRPGVRGIAEPQFAG